MQVLSVRTNKRMEFGYITAITGTTCGEYVDGRTTRVLLESIRNWSADGIHNGFNEQRAADWSIDRPVVAEPDVILHR